MKVALDLDKLQADLTALEKKIIATRGEIDAMTERAADLRQLIIIADRLYGSRASQAANTLAPSQPAKRTPEASLTTEAVALAVLKSGGTWRPQDLAATMQERHGWSTTSQDPSAVVSGALWRLMKSHPEEVVRIGYGRYQFRSDVMDRLAESGHGGSANGKA